MEKFLELLHTIQKNAGAQFSGIGLLICDVPDSIPIFPLRSFVDIPEYEPVGSYFARISVTSSSLHDGFHIISRSHKISKVAQYFSPPILPDVNISYCKLFGGRYLAALFGSALPSIVMSGIASPNFGLALFRNGREIYFEGAE
jgi:hypothetical protein